MLATNSGVVTLSCESKAQLKEWVADIEQLIKALESDHTTPEGEVHLSFHLLPYRLHLTIQGDSRTNTKKGH